ncbi:hypothetical protein N7454_008520 [Penicillium verhagenii]|nr:hypothetical protein N7454_008520 [Penicillium verhagenii]
MMYSTPARQRMSQSRAPSSAQSGGPSSAQRSTAWSTNVPEMPPYEPPSDPLNIETNRQLKALLSSSNYRDLGTHISHAVQELTNSGGDVNERLQEARMRYETAKERRRARAQKKDAEGDSNEEEEGNENETEEVEELGVLERKTEEVTGKMEEKVRNMIDMTFRLEELAKSVEHVNRDEDAQNANVDPRRTRAGGRRQQRGDDDEGGDDPADEDFEVAQNQEARERYSQNPPSRRVREGIETGAQKWDGMSLTERYATHNSYVGFYRAVHDSKFPHNEAPPLPHSSTWFQHMEDPDTSSATQSRNTSGRRNQSARGRQEPSAPDSDDDIAIQREIISLKCPLTLLPYQDPVTSTKCPHSFEREAIHNMIARSNITIAVRPGRRERSVKCPVCTTPLTAGDLQPDAALLRRVQRAKRLADQEAEEDEPRSAGDRNEVNLGSDDIDDDDMEVDVDVDLDEEVKLPVSSARVKAEPMDGAMSNDDENEESEESEGSEESADQDVDMESSEDAESEEEE